MSLVLESKVGGDFKPHVEGIHPAVCVDVIDLGMMETEFQGQRRLVNKVRVFFETEQRNEEGKNCVITKTFTASLHPKANERRDGTRIEARRPPRPCEQHMTCAQCSLLGPVDIYPCLATGRLFRLLR